MLGPPLRKDLTWSSALGSVALVRSMPVVVIQVPIQRDLHRGGSSEVPAAKLNSPVLVEDGPLKAFHKAVGPGMTGLGAGMSDAQLSARMVKGSPKLAALVGEHALHRPAGLAKRRHDPSGEKAGCGLGGEVERDLGHRERAGRVARRQLPHLPHAFELPNIES